MLNKTPTPKLMAVPPDQVLHFWPKVFPLFERAYRRVDIEMPGDLASRAAAGELLLWMVADAALTDVIFAFLTELQLRPSGTLVCHLKVAAGKQMRDWLPLQAELERYAREEGCSKMTAEGRPGWARSLHGYKEIRRVIEKDL